MTWYSCAARPNRSRQCNCIDDTIVSTIQLQDTIQLQGTMVFRIMKKGTDSPETANYKYDQVASTFKAFISQGFSFLTNSHTTSAFQSFLCLANPRPTSTFQSFSCLTNSPTTRLQTCLSTTSFCWASVLLWLSRQLYVSPKTRVGKHGVPKACRPSPRISSNGNYCHLELTY